MFTDELCTIVMLRAFMHALCDLVEGALQNNDDYPHV
jgi:hypothetical protein